MCKAYTLLCTVPVHFYEKHDARLTLKTGCDTLSQLNAQRTKAHGTLTRRHDTLYDNPRSPTHLWV